MDLKDIQKELTNLPLLNESATTLFLIGKYLGLSTDVIIIDDRDLQTISRKGLLKRNANGLILNLDNLVRKDYNDDIEDNLEAYRNVFKGLFTGSMGSPEGCRTKLLRWLKNNSQYEMKDVIEAARFWVDSKTAENPGKKYLIGQADYFIYKKEGKDELSRLSSVIGEASLSIPEENMFDTFL